MIIAIDFDGTIAIDRYPEIGLPLPYAKDVINELHDKGHFIIIWTSRSGAHLIDAVNWLMSRGIQFDRINESDPVNKSRYGGNNRKVYADVYIDDHNIGGFPGWQCVRDSLIGIYQNND